MGATSRSHKVFNKLSKTYILHLKYITSLRCLSLWSLNETPYSAYQHIHGWWVDVALHFWDQFIHSISHWWSLVDELFSCRRAFVIYVAYHVSNYYCFQPQIWAKCGLESSKELTAWETNAQEKKNQVPSHWASSLRIWSFFTCSKGPAATLPRQVSLKVFKPLKHRRCTKSLSGTPPCNLNAFNASRKRFLQG